MNTPIRTNEIEYTFNFDNLMRRYDVYKITTTEKHFASDSSMLDSPLLCDNVCSIVYESGKSLFILMNKTVGSKQGLRKALAALPGFQFITISAESLPAVPSHIMLQLLLNSLGTYRSEVLKVNNLTGHLYCFHSKWIKRSGKGAESFISKIPALELRISSDDKMIINVRTFTSVKLKSHIQFEKNNLGIILNMFFLLKIPSVVN